MTTAIELSDDETRALDCGEEHPLVVFDGVCNLCDSTVQFIIAHDPEGRFRFVSLQSERGQRVLRRHDLPTSDFDSVVLVHRDRYYRYSSAALRIAALFGGAWWAMKVFLVVPRFVRDGVYHFIARNRYRWFGKKDVCMMPTPELRARFLK